eukprot:3753591-Pyramimonas_sp.AAC.1
MQAYSYPDLLMMGLLHTQIYSYPDSRSQTCSYTDLLILRPTHTQTFSWSELLNARTETYSCADPVILRFARGAARCVFTGLFAASLWGCLR